MTDRHDPDLTLPDLADALPGGAPTWELALTVVFHPDTGRIGERAAVPLPTDGSTWILGRWNPAFGRNPDRAEALGERFVSRQAVALHRSGKGLLLRRMSGSSRCRLDGCDLEGECLLDETRLRRGVSLLLGHGIVLLLRLAPPPVAASTLLPELLGGSACLSRLRAEVARAAAADCDVLIRGETGTGKELVARALHRGSARADRPLVSVNMAAIPEGLGPSLLFGSAKGAFTGANAAAEGYFRQAEGGTLFLDEIGDAPGDLQLQLLRALQQREIQPVGGRIRRVDVRVISATDADLEGGSGFRSALRHRLGASELRVPALREHPEDIGELFLHYLEVARLEDGAVGCAPPRAGDPAPRVAAWAALFEACLAYDWPGNVRQLANLARRVALAGSGQGPQWPPELVRVPAAAVARSPDTPSEAEPATRRMRDVGRAELDAALRDNAWEVATTARQLRVSRPALYRRIEESPDHRLAGDVPPEELEQALAQHNGDAAGAAAALRVSASGLRARLRGSGLTWF